MAGKSSTRLLNFTGAKTPTGAAPQTEAFCHTEDVSRTEVSFCTQAVSHTEVVCLTEDCFSI